MFLLILVPLAWGYLLATRLLRVLCDRGSRLLDDLGVSCMHLNPEAVVPGVYSRIQQDPQLKRTASRMAGRGRDAYRVLPDGPADRRRGTAHDKKLGQIRIDLIICR